MLATFSKYFDEETAEAYTRQPEKIANRMKNGNEASGDGWKYRGRGLIQLTGRNNYQDFRETQGVDVVAEPEHVEENPERCVDVAGWYWQSKNLNRDVHQDDVIAGAKNINGGTIGLEDRKDKPARAKQALGV